MKLYRTDRGALVVDEKGRGYLLAGEDWDALIAREDARTHLKERINAGNLPVASIPDQPWAPIVNQEVWAAGVTYTRSREARMDESKSAGGGDFYDRVYSAERPELFFKSSGFRVVGPGGKVKLRSDSKWTVPEPELTLLISSTGKITGYTIGNDMSCRDIEGENPLYLPQAKIYDGACAIGPCILLTDEPLPAETKIRIVIHRGDSIAFEGETSISRIKRPLDSLAEFLFRHTSFPHGCLLMTGTGVVPPDSFSLKSGDEIAMTIDAIGTLMNQVE